MATTTQKTAPKLDDLDTRRARLIADAGEMDDAIRSAASAAEAADIKRREAEGRKAAILREAAKLQAEAEALAGDHGPVRELTELTIATRANVEAATKTLAALHEQVVLLDAQTLRGDYLTQQAKALGATVGPWPQAMDVRPMVTRIENIKAPLGEYLAARAEGLR